MWKLLVTRSTMSRGAPEVWSVKDRISLIESLLLLGGGGGFLFFFLLLSLLFFSSLFSSLQVFTPYVFISYIQTDIKQ